MKKHMGFIFLFFLMQNAASAYSDNRLSLGFGVAQINHPSQTSIAVSAEIEHRLDEYLGLGAFGNYVFSTPGITLIGVPCGYLHPLGGEWYINAAPLFESIAGESLKVGARVGTRVPIPLGSLSLIPQVAIDFINGGQDLIFGLGIQI